jgi:hypothetical protein
MIERIDDFLLFANDGEETLMQTCLIFGQVAPENSKRHIGYADRSSHQTGV